MKNNAVLGVVLFLSALSISSVETQTAKAQGLGHKSSSRSDLGARTQDLLARYGKPTAVCFLADSPPLSPRPIEVPVFSPGEGPDWAQSVLFSLKNRRYAMVWLYKSGDYVVSFLIEPLARVEATCVAGSSGTPVAANGQKFNVFPPATSELGDDPQEVIKRYGYPADIRSIGKSTLEFQYGSYKSASKGVTFTFRGNRVVRIYRYEDLDLPSVEPKPRSNYPLLKHKD